MADETFRRYMANLGVRPLQDRALPESHESSPRPSSAQPQRSSPDAPDNHDAKSDQEDFQSAMQLMGVRPLKGTASLKTSAAPQHPSAAQPQRSSPDAPDNHGAKDTEEDFQSAMQLMGVRPLKGTTVNHTPRLSPAMPKPMGPQDTEPVVAPSTTEPAEDTAAAHALFLEQWTQTPAPESSSPSLKVRQLKSVKSHHLEFDGELDCHGMTLKEAAQALNAFLHDANQHGDRTVLIITGKGHHSPEGRSPMRTWIRHQLTHDHAVRVEAMADAPRQWGGRGATVVYLRKRST